MQLLTVYLKAADSVCWVVSPCGGWKSSANPETSAPNPPEMKPPNDSGTLADRACRDKEWSGWWTAGNTSDPTFVVNNEKYH